MSRRRPIGFYVLGDLLHVWLGDACSPATPTHGASAPVLPSWPRAALKSSSRVANRDFMIGAAFARLAAQSCFRPRPSSHWADIAHCCCTATSCVQTMLPTSAPTRTALSCVSCLWQQSASVPPRRHRSASTSRERGPQGRHRVEHHGRQCDAIVKGHGAPRRRCLIHGHTHRPAHHVLFFFFRRRRALGAVGLAAGLRLPGVGRRPCGSPRPASTAQLASL